MHPCWLKILMLWMCIICNLQLCYKLPWTPKSPLRFSWNVKKNVLVVCVVVVCHSPVPMASVCEETPVNGSPVTGVEFKKGLVHMIFLIMFYNFCFVSEPLQKTDHGNHSFHQNTIVIVLQRIPFKLAFGVFLSFSAETMFTMVYFL